MGFRHLFQRGWGELKQDAKTTGRRTQFRANDILPEKYHPPFRPPKSLDLLIFNGLGAHHPYFYPYPRYYRYPRYYH